MTMTTPFTPLGEKKKSIGIIGLGNIGGLVAFLWVTRQWGSVVLWDASKDVLQGKALDLCHAAGIVGSACHVDIAQSYKDFRDCDHVVITAGLARKPGMDRLDLMRMNGEIILTIAQQLRQWESSASILVVTNPVDLMTAVAHQGLQCSWRKVVGMAGILDSGRFRCQLAQALEVSPAMVEAVVVGPHDDGMVPLFSSVRIQGQPLDAWEKIHKCCLHRQIVQDKTRWAGAEIVGHLKTGSAFYAPAQGVVSMLEAMMFHGERRAIACSVQHSYEDIQDVFSGRLVVWGAQGVEEIPPLTVSPQEHRQLMLSLGKSKTLQREFLSSLG